MSFSFALQNLQLPTLQHTINVGEDSAQDCNLKEWKSNALNTLIALQDLLAQNDLTLTNDHVASVVAIAIPLISHDNLTTESMEAIASGIMTQLPSPTIEVVKRVLTQYIKPWFSKTPHSLINPISGRRLRRAAGGPSAAMDIYEDQEWKTAPAIASLLLWCIQQLKPEDYENVWHLIVPPTMTLIDDYESYYKLKGLTVVSELLKHVPPETLKHTGVDGLLISSLRTTMGHLHSPLSPEILRRSIPLLLRVIDLTTPVNSKRRFDEVCALLGDGIIGGVWIYASTEWATLETSVCALPDVLRELGIGSVRYLKAMISQLAHHLTSPMPQRSLSLQRASLDALEVLIDVCRPRICEWSGLILEGLARCWVLVQDNDSNDKGCPGLKPALRRVSLALSEACPSVIKNEYSRLLACDESMFRGLLSVEYHAR
ncbi:hypothetical protein JB92DRAFT_2978385 [Gautieria morchelliformis]|nr:hypothetical protein JB92DRAFT_2978385 [Gautieria morchelliformis]